MTEPIIKALQIAIDDHDKGVDLLNFLLRIQNMRKYIQPGTWSDSTVAMFSIIKTEFDAMYSDFTKLEVIGK